MKNLIFFFLLAFLCSVPILAKAYPLETKISNKVFVDNAVMNMGTIPASASGILQLFTHGRPGELLIDGKWRNPSEIVYYLLTNKVLAKGTTHINVYGCQFAKGAKGVAAVQYLEIMLGISVSASTNITGKDGDWILEAGRHIEVLSFPGYTGNLQYGPTDDFDGDGILNQNDYDDDNDGVPDYIENGGGQAFSTGAVIPFNVTTNNGISGVFSNGIARADFLIQPKTANTWRTDQYATNGNGYALWATVAGTNVAATIHLDPTPYSGSVIYEARYGYVGWDHSITTGRQQLGSATTLTWDNTDFIAIIHDPLDQLTQADLAQQTNNVTGVTITPRTATTTLVERYYVSFINIKGSSSILNISTTLTASATWEHTGITLYLGNTTGYNYDGTGGTNAFDTDSDDDGDSDAYETGVTGSSPTVFTVTGSDANNNGMEDALEVTGFPFATSYTSTYSSALDAGTIKSLDSDNDGIPDITDIDDDNDGILDVVEAGAGQACANDNAQAVITFTSVVTTTTSTTATVNLNGVPVATIEHKVVGPSVTTANLGMLASNSNEEVAASGGFNGASITRGDLWVSTFTPLAGIKFNGTLEYLTPPKSAAGYSYETNDYTPFFGTNAKGISYTGTFVEVSSGADHSTGTNGAALSSGTKVRLNNAAASNTNYIGWRVNVEADNTHPYVFSAGLENPASGTNGEAMSVNFGLLTCASFANAEVDTDNDGIPNRLDLDSDGDGCPDAVEADVFKTSGGPTMENGTLRNGSGGTVTSTTTKTNAKVAGLYGANGLANSIETTTESGSYKSTYIYSQATDGTTSSNCSFSMVTLPLNWLGISATLTTTAAKINWLAGEERNVDYYEVYRSTNGIHFTAIGRVTALNNNAFTNNYTYLDHEALALSATKVYYYVRSVDFDRSKSNSKVVQVQLNGSSPKIGLYPNPSQGEINFTSLTGIKHIRVYSANGGLVKQFQNINSASLKYDLRMLPAGYYTIRLVKDNGDGISLPLSVVK